MLKLFNPYVLLVAGLIALSLFTGGFIAGKKSAQQKMLETALGASQEQTRLANQGAQTLTRVANEKDDSVTSSAIDEWMRSPRPWK